MTNLKFFIKGSIFGLICWGILALSILSGCVTPGSNYQSNYQTTRVRTYDNSGNYTGYEEKGEFRTRIYKFGKKGHIYNGYKK